MLHNHLLRIRISLLLRALVLIVLIGLPGWMLAGRLLSPTPEVSSAPTIEQLQPLAALLTSRVVVTDAVVTTITGRTGQLRAAVLVRGDALISVDLTQARIESADQDARTAVVVLPPPQVISARVDHEATRIFSVEATGLWSLVPGDDGRAELIEMAMRQAQTAVLRAASEPEVIEQAQAKAEGLIRSFFAETMRWSVIVCWTDKAGTR